MDSNILTGSEKDKLRKKFGHNILSGSEKDFGRRAKARALDKAKKGIRIPTGAGFAKRGENDEKDGKSHL